MATCQGLQPQKLFRWSKICTAVAFKVLSAEKNLLEHKFVAELEKALFRSQARYSCKGLGSVIK